MKRISSFLVMVALLAGVVGCGEVTPPAQYDLTMSVAPAGSGTATDLTNASPYAAETVVSITAVAAVGYQFASWASPAGTFASATGAQTTFTMPSQNVTVTANFVRVYDLTMVANPVGQGTAADLTNASPYAEGTSVSIRAVGTAGYHFVNWEASAGTFGNATLAQTTFTMPAQNATVTANFAVDLYFWVDANCVLHGPATLPPEQRNPSVLLQIYTNVVVHSVRVDLPGGRSISIPAYTDVFTPEVEWTTLFRFVGGEPGMPVAGGEYVFTGLDVTGEPIPEATDTDVWAGVEPPKPPTNVRAELTEDGILVRWDESPEVPGSFEPAADPPFGFYQIGIYRVETGEDIYGVNLISVPSYVIHQEKADFTGYDHGLSLGEMEDGTYCVVVSSHGMAPEGSLGRGHEYTCSDPGQTIIFTIQDGEITVE